MLDSARIGANVPVSNLDDAISFYEGKLGLRLFEQGEGQPYARFAGAGETKLGIKTDDGVAAMGDTRAAWLKDPDGNILEIVGA
jgi:catechol-2,3-dioxygenase